MLIYILLGYFISNLITLIVFMATDEDEDKTIMTSLGIAWVFVLIARLFVKITKWNDYNNEAKRLEQATKKLLKKESITDRDWEKFYKKQGKKTSTAWGIFAKTKTNQQLQARGFYDWRKTYLDKKYQEEHCED